MSIDREQRLAAVESENLELKARIAALEAKGKPRPPAPVDEGVVRITTLQPFHGGDQPTPQQFEQLLEIVARSHPNIVPTWPENRWGTQYSDRQKYMTGFAQCFRRIGDLWRLPGSELGKHRRNFG